jgi:hypothetical protein
MTGSYGNRVIANLVHFSPLGFICLTLLINSCQKQALVVHSDLRLALHEIIALHEYHAADGGNTLPF